MKKISIILLAVFFIGIANINAQTDVTTNTTLVMEEKKEVKTCTDTGKVCDTTCKKKKNSTCCKGEKKKSCSKLKSSSSKSTESSFNFDKSNNYGDEKASCSKKAKKGCCKKKTKTCGDNCIKSCCAPPTPAINETTSSKK